MNKEVKAKWVAALRSGRYKQGTGCLRDAKNKYCCLGVLTDVARKEKVIGNPRKVDGRYEYVGENAVLPAPVRDWAGLFSADPMLGDDDAVTLNDDKGYNFNQIADLIEEQL